MERRAIDELEARIAAQRNTIDTWTSARGAIEQRALANIGFAWFDIAVCTSLLGSPAEAKIAFLESSRWMFDSVGKAQNPPLATYVSALEAAVLSGDQKMTSDIAANPQPPEERPSLVDDRLAWALALPALILGDSELALTHADEARSVAAAKAWYPGLGESLRALVQRDGEALERGLKMILDKHRKYARSSRSWCYNWGPCLMCIPAIVITKLALGVGLQAHGVESQARLGLTAMFTEPRVKVEIEIDFIPKELIS